MSLRVRPLLAFLLLCTPALAGCLSLPDLLGVPAPVEENAAKEVDWTALPGLAERPDRAAFGFRLSDDAPPLRFVAPPSDENLDTEVPGPLALHIPLLLIYGPDGQVLYRDDPGDDEIARNATGSDAAAAQPERDLVLVALNEPQPGAYTVVLYGAVVVPRVEVLVDDTTPLPQLVPLDLTHRRSAVHGDPGLDSVRPMAASGRVHAPPRLALAWLAPMGETASTSLSVRTERGLHSQIDSLETNRAGIHGFVPGIIGTRSTVLDPRVLDGGPLDWSVEGVGVGAVLLYTLVASPVPHLPDAPRSAVAGYAELTPLTGTIDAETGAWFDLPERSAVRLDVITSGSATAHATVRVYDAAGTLLSNQVLHGDGTPLPAPAGIVFVINDGPGSVAANVFGRAPSDASIHALNTTTETVFVAANDGHAAAQVTLDGPVRWAMVGSNGLLMGLHVTISAVDEGHVTSMPYPDRRGHEEPCCQPLPFIMGPAAPGLQLHPGTYRLVLTAAEATNGFEVRFDVYDLAEVRDKA